MVSSLSPADIDHDIEVAAVVSSLGPDTDCSNCVCIHVSVYARMSVSQCQENINYADGTDSKCRIDY